MVDRHLAQVKRPIKRLSAVARFVFRLSARIFAMLKPI